MSTVLFFISFTENSIEKVVDSDGAIEDYGEHDPAEAGSSSMPSIRSGLRMYAAATLQNVIDSLFLIKLSDKTHENSGYSR